MPVTVLRNDVIYSFTFINILCETLSVGFSASNLSQLNSAASTTRIVQHSYPGFDSDMYLFLFLFLFLFLYLLLWIVADIISWHNCLCGSVQVIYACPAVGPAVNLVIRVALFKILVVHLFVVD